jgi:hypothetical protein
MANGNTARCNTRATTSRAAITRNNNAQQQRATTTRNNNAQQQRVLQSSRYNTALS